MTVFYLVITTKTRSRNAVMKSRKPLAYYDFLVPVVLSRD